MFLEGLEEKAVQGFKKITGQQPTSKRSVSLPARKTHQELYFLRFSLHNPGVCLPLARVCSADGL